MKNSVEGYAGTGEIAADSAAGLERSCRTDTRDGIVEAPSSRGIERIEARFHGNGFSPHRHDTYALGLTLSGVQTFAYRGSSRFSMPGNIIVLHPDEVHDGAAGTEAGLVYRMLYLPPERLTEAAGGRRGLPFVPDPVIADENFRLSLAEALEDLHTEAQGLLLDDLTARFAEGLWRHADQTGRSLIASTAHKAMLRCRDYLQDNCGREVSSSELEEISGMDRYTTARQFRKVFGTSPHRYLVMRRLDSARALIAAGDSLANAAAEAGFADQAHFTRHFRNAFGMTPGRWSALSKTAVDRPAHIRKNCFRL